jgi:hypothetical protein
MGGDNFILTYVQACTSGNLSFSDCGPIWQLGIIAALLVVAAICLIALRIRPREPTEQS